MRNKETSKCLDPENSKITNDQFYNGSLPMFAKIKILLERKAIQQMDIKFGFSPNLPIFQKKFSAWKDIGLRLLKCVNLIAFHFGYGIVIILFIMTEKCDKLCC